jgi:hypothetical protein
MGVFLALRVERKETIFESSVRNLIGIISITQQYFVISETMRLASEQQF